MRFADIGYDIPRNTAISTDKMGAASDENGSNFTDREVLISKNNSRPIRADDGANWREIK